VYLAVCLEEISGKHIFTATHNGDIIVTVFLKNEFSQAGHEPRRLIAMTLLPDEKILAESNIKGLTLTTHRVRFKASGTRQIDFASIMLEQVASCSAAHRSSPLLLALAALALLTGIILQQENSRAINSLQILVFGVVVAVVLVILYLSSKYQVLTISAAQGSIKVRMSGTDTKNAEGFIDALESAKNDRFALTTGNRSMSAGA
jgi:hypothetical protein